MIQSILSIGWGGLFEILVLSVAFYYVFIFLQGTRGAQVLVGMLLALAGLLGLTYVLNLVELNWLLRNISFYLAVAFIVIFQPEIRRALAELGRQPVFNPGTDRRPMIDSIVHAVTHLSDHKVGALIAIEREIGTRAIRETGIKLEAPVVPELLASIFFPHTPLHDGGVIIQGNRLMAASCVFPLSQRMELHKSLGTRHRAAVGLSDETDAVVIVVSEETGTISVCYRGRLSRGLDGERLKRFLAALLKGSREESALKRIQEQLDLTPEGIAKSDKRAEEAADVR
ncbi:MAG TPA: TIGR00159 family protein [Verrucomicrobia bacterium]|nr:TIGR00159 family protein [Verrucomicrobiota bacterium]